MPFYHRFQSTRSTRPDPIALRTSVRAALGDPTAVLLDPADSGTWTGKKANAWSVADITATQAVLDGAPTETPQLSAQRNVDGYSIEMRALVLALIDGLNVVRSKLPTPLPPITPAQALQAIRDKAGTLL